MAKEDALVRGRGDDQSLYVKACLQSLQRMLRWSFQVRCYFLGLKGGEIRCVSGDVRRLANAGAWVYQADLRVVLGQQGGQRSSWTDGGACEGAVFSSWAFSLHGYIVGSGRGCKRISMPPVKCPLLQDTQKVVPRPIDDKTDG